MHVISTFIPVIMFVLSYGSEVSINNLNEICVKNRTLTYFITAKLSPTDAFIGDISSHKTLHCSLIFNTLPTHYIILALHFENWYAGRKLCGPIVNEIYISLDGKLVEICAQSDRQTFRAIEKSKTAVLINAKKNLPPIKILATAARGSSGKCDDSKEISCKDGPAVYCLPKIFLCDGYPNCGFEDRFDEDPQKCSASSLSPKVIIMSIIITLVSFWLIVSIAINLVPRRKEGFIYKYTQSMSLNDVEKNLTNVEIIIHILYPDENEPDRAKTSRNKRN